MCIHVAFWNLLCHSTALRAAPRSFRLTVQSLDPCRARVAQASPWESQAPLYPLKLIVSGLSVPRMPFSSQ